MRCRHAQLDSQTGERIVYGVSSMTSTLRRVALSRPGVALLEAESSVWHYGPTFDRHKVLAQHETFSELLAGYGVEILWMDENNPKIADAVFAYDASLMTPAGAILMNPGKLLRQGEQALHQAFYERLNIRVIGEISGDARAEAGDTLWLDNNTLAIGRGFRTNQSGIDQMTESLADQGITVHAFDVPYYQGAAACLHLMSLVSLVDTKTAAICETLFPVALYQLMQALGYHFISLPYVEYQTSGTLSGNILTVAPGECIMIDGFPDTRNALEAAGINLKVFDGDALCIGCEGGPTCLTRPILRS
jgi:dimethylargininase